MSEQTKQTAEQIISVHEAERIKALADIATLKNYIEEKEIRIGQITAIINTAEALKPEPVEPPPEEDPDIEKGTEVNEGLTGDPDKEGAIAP